MYKPKRRKTGTTVYSTGFRSTDGWIPEGTAGVVVNTHPCFISWGDDLITPVLSSDVANTPDQALAINFRRRKNVVNSRWVEPTNVEA